MMWHLQNLLEAQDGLNPAQRRELISELEKLEREALPEKEERALWNKVKREAPGFLSNPMVLKIISEVVTDPQLRKAIGL